MIHSMAKHAGVLSIVALVSTGLVALTHALTKDTIEEKTQEQRLALLNQVIPANLHDNALNQTCRLISSEALGSDELMPLFFAEKNDKPSAYAIEAIAPDGYNGKIKILVGVDTNKKVLGVRVLQHNETPGLGDKIELDVSNWILTLSNKLMTSKDDERWAVQKDGGQFDQFTGATITPRAVINASKKAAWFVIENRDKLLTLSRPCGDQK